MEPVKGSGNSLMIWCFISSALFDYHQAHAFGATFESPDRTGVTITFSMVGFVDDSTGSDNDFHTTTIMPPWTHFLAVSKLMLNFGTTSYGVLAVCLNFRNAPIISYSLILTPPASLSLDRAPSAHPSKLHLPWAKRFLSLLKTSTLHIKHSAITRLLPARQKLNC
jgi:hypothetical protein